MKFAIGSFAALLLALTVSLPAYSKVPAQTTTAGTPSTATKTNMTKTTKKSSKSKHHKKHSSTKKNATTTPSKP